MRELVRSGWLIEGEGSTDGEARGREASLRLL